MEQLAEHIHEWPENTFIFLIPRLCTWQKQLGKICDVILTIQPKHKFWDKSMHDLLLVGLYFLPLLPPLVKFRLWIFK